MVEETTPMDYEPDGRFYDPDFPDYEPEYFERVYGNLDAVPKKFLLEQFRNAGRKSQRRFTVNLCQG